MTSALVHLVIIICYLHGCEVDYSPPLELSQCAIRAVMIGPAINAEVAKQHLKEKPIVTLACVGPPGTYGI